MSLVNINTGASDSGWQWTGFTNNSNVRPRICVTAETDDFDTDTLRNWKSEEMDVIYVPFGNGGKAYLDQLNSVKAGLGVGEQYAIIAFGDAAAFCLDHFRKPTTGARLTALIAYYPTNIPEARTRFPPTLRVLVHLAGESVGVVTFPQALGIQGKRRVRTKRIQPGIGLGERLNLAFPTFTYEFAQPGFAEHDLDEYDQVSAELAWTRSLEIIRRAFRKDADLEKTVEDNQESKFFTGDLADTMATYTTHRNPAVTYAPTAKGGVGGRALRQFYENQFLDSKPPSMRLRLLSRTVGADRVVDEFYTSFEHTQEMPWMLPGVAPTNRKVEIVMVSIVCLKAGKLFSEHVYWDQASVLLQIGLLYPKLVPDGVQGVKRLPVLGKEAARRILLEHPARGEEYHQQLVTKKPAVTGKSKNGKKKGANSSVNSSVNGSVNGSVKSAPQDKRNKGKSVDRGLNENGHSNGTNNGATNGDNAHEEEPQHSLTDQNGDPNGTEAENETEHEIEHEQTSVGRPASVEDVDEEE